MTCPRCTGRLRLDVDEERQPFVMCMICGARTYQPWVVPPIKMEGRASLRYCIRCQVQETMQGQFCNPCRETARLGAIKGNQTRATRREA